MTKPNASKALLIHASIWVAYFVLLSTPFYRLMPMYGIIEWTETVYNCAAITACFYATAYCVNGYMRAFSLLRYRRLGGFGKMAYLIFNRHLAKVLMVVGVYVGVSLLLDNQFFGHVDTPLDLQFERRFSRIMAYIGFATVYAFFRWYIDKLEAIIRALRRQNKELVTDIHRVNYMFNILLKEVTPN
jgi:hypothetical protein